MPMLESPRTQAMGAVNGGAPGDQAKSLFDQGLSQMAYNVLINKLPNVSPDVVTFKVLDSDHEEGAGVGAFVLSRRGQTVYVPVVMADNQIKPLDILYYKDLNVFLPLTKEWLEELDKLSLGELGRGTTPPQTLQTDVDIRNMVVPPTTGRYSYAAENDAARVFDEARVQVDPKPCFLDFLDRAPNRVKRAAARLFETQPKILKLAVWNYGADALTSALRLNDEKQADYGGKLSRTGGLYIADKKTKSTEFKEIWGDQAGVAYQGVAVKSYYAKDERKNLKRALKVQNEVKLTEPKDAGAYRIWKKDGTELLAFIVNGPHNIFKDNELCCGSGYGNESWRKRKTPKRFVGVTEEGRLLDQRELMGEPVPFGELEGSKMYKKLVADEAKDGPRIGQWGIFAKREGAGGFICTTPVLVKAVTTLEEGVKQYEVTESDYEGSERRIVILDGDARTLHGKGSTRIHLSRDYRWLPVQGAKYEARYRDRDFISNPSDVLSVIFGKLEKAGATSFTVKKARDRGFVFGNEPRKDFDFTDSLRKLALEAHISVEEAATVLKTAQGNGRAEIFVLDDAAYTKLAAGEQPQQPDQAQQAMDQVAGAQMAAPAGPSPVDMAVAEQLQTLQMQAQSIQQQMQMLSTVQQRANMIAGTGGAMGNPAAAAAAMGGPMDPSMMGAGAPVDPSMGGGAPPQQGGMMSGGPPGGMMGGAPSPVPGAPGAGSPQAAMGGMQPGMDPSQQGQPPPQAAMTSEDGSVESLMQQVNPQFVEQAGALNDAGVFDAAALSSMAQSPQLKDLVGAYIPNLEKSLDNIGRVLLTLWMDERKIKEDIGDETYIGLEDNLRTVFKGLGELILKINQNTAVLRAGMMPGGEV